MNIRNVLASIFGKASAAGPVYSHLVAGKPVYTPIQYGKLSKEGYAKCVIVYRCIDLISKSAAAVPLLLYQRTATDPREIDNHPIIDLLRKPNPGQSGFEFIVDISAYLNIAGNTYLERVGGTLSKEPKELYALRPDRMSVVAGSFGLPEAFIYGTGIKPKKWEVDPITGESEILHIKYFNPTDDWYGLGPMEVAARSVDQRNSADDHNLALMQNGGRLSGLLAFEGKEGADFADDQRLALENQIKRKFTGPSNAGRVIMSGGGSGKFTWTEMGVNPKDMDWLNSKESNSSDIANAYGVPQQLIGIQSAQTFSNMREARLWLYEETVLPHMRQILDGLNMWLTPIWGEDLYLDFDEDKISALSPRRERTWEKVQDAQFLTINEKREAVGYENVPGGDVLFVPATLLPLEFAAEPPAAQAPAPEPDDTPDEDDEDTGKALEIQLASAYVASGGIEYKLLNDRGRNARQREILLQTRLQAAFERSLRVRAARILSARVRLASEAFAKGGVDGAELAMEGHEAEINSMLRAHWQTVFETFGNRILDAVKSSGMALDEKSGMEQKEDSLFDRLTLEWIDANAADKVTAISSTTRAQISTAIAQGQAEGLGVPAIAKLINTQVGGIHTKFRANLIARTETHSAAVAGADEAARSTGLADLQREWISVEDSRTRDSHNDADGQRRKMGDDFDVGGVSLIRPGDPSGPPGETINCRCVLGVIAPDEE
jgi:HK97 family phage portal protein